MIDTFFASEFEIINVDRPDFSIRTQNDSVKIDFIELFYPMRIGLTLNNKGDGISIEGCIYDFKLNAAGQIMQLFLESEQFGCLTEKATIAEC